MAINFPDSPSLNDSHVEGGRRWKWNGTVWERIPASGAQGVQGVQGAAGAQGSQGHQGLPAGGYANKNLIVPDAYAVVGTASSGTGLGMNWGAYNSSNQRVEFTFHYAQPNANYYVHTNREHYATHNIEVTNKTTTGFRTRWTNNDGSALSPATFAGVLIVYASDPIEMVGIGSTGNVGAQGHQGRQGAQGYQGVLGAQGAQGHQGVQGAQGAQGRQGAQGVQGAVGAQGAQGHQGHQGVQGAQGHQGHQGVQGAQGHQGHQGVQGAVGAQGKQGTVGAQGADGNFGGATFDYTFDTTTSDADPGAGKLRLNNALVNAATVMYIDDEDGGGTDIQSFLRTIDDSTSTVKGHFRISNRLDASDYALYTISGTNTEATGYHKVNCGISTASAVSFSNNEDIIITFARTGTKGDTGNTGAQGHQGVQGAQGHQGVQGAVGAQGAQGRQGAAGAQGAQGHQGHQGVQGAQGRQGATGNTGAQGHQGVQGATGNATINNNANNRVITGSGTANTLEAETSLEWDGTDTLKVIHGSSYPDFKVKSSAGGGTIELFRAGNGPFRIGNTTGSFLSAADDLVIGGGSGSRGLTIYGGASDGGFIAFADGTSDPAYRMGQIIYDHSANEMLFRTNGNHNRLIIDNGGNLGINETSPDNKLHITTTEDTDYSTNSHNTQNITNALLKLENLSGSDNSGVNNYVGIQFSVANGANSTAQLNYVRTGNNAGAFQFKARNAASTYPNLMTITSAGKVGIGTNDLEANAALDIWGDGSAYPTLRLGTEIYQTEGEDIRFGRTDHGASDIRYHSITSFHDASAAANYLKFKLHDGSSVTSQSTVLSLWGSGSVRIGDAATHTFSAHSEGDDLVIGGAGWRGMTIYGEGGGGVIQFADNGDNRRGQILYNHGNDSMDFRVNGNQTRLSINNVGEIEFTASDSGTTDFQFYNSTQGGNADVRVLIKTYANAGADPYIKFDSGGSNHVVGQLYGGTTNNKLVLGTGDSPSGGVTGITVDGNGNTYFRGSSANTTKANIHLKQPSNNWEDGVLLEHSGAATGWNIHAENGDNSLFIGYNSNVGNSYTGQVADLRLKLWGDGTITPGTDANQDFGTSSLRWKNIYTTDLQLSNIGGGGNEVDGTEGKWTLQEGEDDVYMINRKTGKKYKMMLQEVS